MKQFVQLLGQSEDPDGGLSLSKDYTGVNDYDDGNDNDNEYDDLTPRATPTPSVDTIESNDAEQAKTVDPDTGSVSYEGSHFLETKSDKQVDSECNNFETHVAYDDIWRKIGHGHQETTGIPAPRTDIKSRFTEYSMTSSILPRSEVLQHIDEGFEKFYEKVSCLQCCCDRSHFSSLISFR